MTDQVAFSRVDTFLHKLAGELPRRGNLIFALDATASRKPTWDAACQLQAQMFSEVTKIGSLSLQLVYYRGPRDLGGECKASRWLDRPMEPSALMSKITCEAGHTQISKVLAHVRHEAALRKINAMVFVGDAYEEGSDHLAQKAAYLGGLKVPVIMFQEGQDPDAEKCFREIARLTGGAHHHFDQGSVSQLAELLKAVALFSVGGVAALEKQGSTAAKRLLAQVTPTA